MESNDKNNVKTKEENKKIIILVVAILILILVIYLILNLLGNKKVATPTEAENVIKNADTAILYIWNSDDKKCADCEKIKKYIDKINLNYMSYDVKDYSTKKYEKLLTTLGINPPDFNYPAVVFIKDGVMYSNIINIDNTKSVDTFVKEYKLNDVK